MTGRRLRQVELRKQYGPPFAIDYLFGQIPRGPKGIPDLGSSRTAYLIIEESTRLFPDGRMQVAHASGWEGPEQRPIPQPWQLTVNIPSWALALDIMSNQPGRVLRRVAFAILHRAATQRGKA